MAFMQTQGPMFNTYKDLITAQLGIVGRVGSTFTVPEEKDMIGGITFSESFILAVQTLDDMLYPVWDADYKAEREPIFRPQGQAISKLSLVNAHQLLRIAMKLVMRQKILVHIKDINV